MRKNYTNIGFSSVLVVFVSIAFLSFGVLSLLTAHADYRLTEKTALRNQDYYKVKSNSEMFLEELDEKILNKYNSASSEDNFFTSLEYYFTNIDTSSFNVNPDTFDYDIDTHILTYTMRVSSLQVLSVNLEITYPSEMNGYNFYNIINQNTFTDMEQEAINEPLHLLGGD